MMGRYEQSAKPARSDDRIIETVGVELLRELKAICWFCDAGVDGKYALVPSNRRHWYMPGGQHHALVESGCVRLLKSTYCETIRQSRPALRMEQVGRRVLLRAKALGLELEPQPAEEDAYVG